MNCKCCGNPIEKARLDATKNKAKTCISCMRDNDTQRVAGHRLITGKTEYSALEIVTPEQAKQLYEAGYRRGQSPMAGARMRGH